MRRSFLSIPAFIISCVLLSSCQKEVPLSETSAPAASPMAESIQAMKHNTFKGPQVEMGDGYVRTFATITHSGVPLEIGIEMTAASFQGLPTSPENMFNVPLHQKAREVTPFEYVGLGWNPHGHPPPGIYPLPHFDVHFNMLTQEEVMAIPVPGSLPNLFDVNPAPGYLPSGYVPGPSVPQMGKHWIDVMSDEFRGATFTRTFVYGSYNGDVTFYEPMITKAFIESGANITMPIRQPQFYSPTNTYYPTMYKVYTDARTGSHYISLSGFVKR